MWITGRAEARDRCRCWHGWLGNLEWLGKLLLWLLRHEHIRSGCRWNGSDVELRRLIVLLDLLALGIDVQLMLELCAIGFHIGCATGAGTESEFDVEAAHAIGTGSSSSFVLGVVS